MTVVDFAVLIVYLLFTLGIGAYFSRRNDSTEEYFVGGRAYPGWVIGLSMLATSISSITFLAFPADAYKLDWRQLVFNWMLPIVTILAIMVFIPFFRRGRLTSAFEYLEDRYGRPVRMYGAASFLILQLIRMSTILNLVSIPVQQFTGLDPIIVIVAMGLFIGLYTVLGGIDAVIWTDVIQAIVLWGGGALCLVCMIAQIPGGLSEIVATGQAHQKFNIGDMEWDVGRRTFWTVAVLGVFQWLALYTSDQTFVQRYVAARSLYEARRAAAIYMLCAIPTWTFFFFLGTSLFVFYQVQPDPRVATMQADMVFPHFILTQLPTGFGGLVISAVLAAAMSSVDSSLNSISTVAIVDVVRPFSRQPLSDAFCLKLARIVASLGTVLAILGAVIISRIEKESLNNFNLVMASLFGGCLVGLFLIGFFTTRVDAVSATLAVLGAILANGYLAFSAAGRLPAAWTLGIHEFWVSFLVNVVFGVLAYGLGRLRHLGKDPDLKRLAGLTVWTLELPSATDGAPPA